VLHVEFLMCPVKDITWKPFNRAACDTSDLRKDYIFTYEFPLVLWKITFPLKKLHVHTFILGLFASLLAPLGGLFASGFKRAIKIKDFANLIPGHGGLTDRMDCQILMVYFYIIF
jgi:phosphatidate cytidylyltransferase